MSDLQHLRIAELCQELRLSAVPNLYPGIAQGTAAKDASFADFLEETLRGERDARSARAREMFARVAGFPAIKTLDGFDFGFAAGVPRPQRFVNSPAWPLSSALRTLSSSVRPVSARRTWRLHSATWPPSTATRCALPRPPI